MGVVVLDEDGEHHLQLAAVEDQHSVETFPADSADEAFGEYIGPWSTDRRSDYSDSVRAKHLVEARGELGVAVPNEEPDRSCSHR